MTVVETVRVNVIRALGIRRSVGCVNDLKEKKCN